MKKFWWGFLVGMITAIPTGLIVMAVALLLIGTYSQRFGSRGLSAPELHRLGGQTNFDYSTLDGNTRHSADLRGKVLIVSVWAAWCGPCKRELPTVQKLYEHYKDNPEVEILAVSEDEPDKIRSVAKSVHVQLPFYTITADTLPPALAVDSYPTTFIVGKDGIVAARHNGAADWSHNSVLEFIDELRKEPAPVEAARSMAQ